MRADVSKINLTSVHKRSEIEGTFGEKVSTHWIEIAIATALLKKAPIPSMLQPLLLSRCARSAIDARTYARPGARYFFERLTSRRAPAR